MNGIYEIIMERSNEPRHIAIANAKQDLNTSGALYDVIKHKDTLQEKIEDTPDAMARCGQSGANALYVFDALYEAAADKAIQEIYKTIESQPRDNRIHLVMDKAALELHEKGLLDKVPYLNSKIEKMIDKMPDILPGYAQNASYAQHVLDGVNARAKNPQMIKGAEYRAEIVGYSPSNVIQLKPSRQEQSPMHYAKAR